VLLSAGATMVTVALAFLGFIVNHMSGVRRHQLEARFAFVSAQLERLYGPLYALVQSNTASYRASFRPDAPLFDRTKPFDERERAIWRTWAENVFVPSNLKIRDVLEQNAHLVLGGQIPPVFEEVLAHIESSKLVLPLLADGDLSLLDQFKPWPKDFNATVQQSYLAIVAEHDRLLGRIRRKPLPAPKAVAAPAR
jgi:uncharacterized protein YqcC (DUF446 family)